MRRISKKGEILWEVDELLEYGTKLQWGRGWCEIDYGRRFGGSGGGMAERIFERGICIGSEDGHG